MSLRHRIGIVKKQKRKEQQFASLYCIDETLSLQCRFAPTFGDFYDLKYTAAIYMIFDEFESVLFIFQNFFNILLLRISPNMEGKYSF